MATRMQQRRGTAAQWISVNNGDGPTLAAGEIGFETDTGKFKIGDGVNPWVDLVYYASADDLAAVIDGAPALLDTLNELAAAIGDDPNFINTMASKLYVDDAVDNHVGATTSVHGIANTADLATMDYADTAATNAAGAAVSAHEADVTNVHGIADTSALATKQYADSAVSTHTADTTNVHGIVDTSVLATLTDVSTAQDNAEGFADNAVTVHNAATTDVHGIADTADLATQSDIAGANTYADDAVGVHNLDTTSVHGIADTTALATKTYADNAVSAHSSDTTSIHGIADTSALALTADVDDALALKQDKVTGVSDTEIGYLDGVTSAIQTQIDGKAATSHSHSQQDITNLTDDLAAKAPLAGPTFTGTVVLPSTTSIGNVSATEIGYVDGVTSAIQTQLNAKAPLAGPTFTGTVNAADLILSGNLTVQGTTTTVDTQDLVVSDPMIYIGEGNSANLVDLGFVSSFDNGTYQHSGLVRDASDNKWKLFKGVTDEPTTTVNFSQGSLDDLAVGGLTASSLTVGSVSNTELGYLDGVTSAIQTQIDSKSPIASPTFTGTVTVSSSGVAFTDGTQTKEGVPSRTPISQKSAGYTLSALTERDSLIEISSATGVTLTIPTNATVAFPVGTSIDILQTGAGQITIAGAAGVTVNATPGLKLRTQWSGATLFKRATDTWVVYGDLSA